MDKSFINNHETLGEVSILLTNYNKGAHLEAIFELSKALLQKGAEIVIVDDGSTDRSFERLLEFSAQNPAMYVVNQSNQGSAVSRNRAISLASRDYLVFLDFDDLIFINPLENALMEIKQQKSKMAILNYEIYPEKKQSSMPVVMNKPEMINIQSYREDFFRAMGYWRYVYSRKFITEH